MNASLAALLVMVLLGGGWLLGRRRPRPFLSSTDTADVVSLNRAQIERLREGLTPGASPDDPASDVTPAPPQPGSPLVARLPVPSRAGQRPALLRQLLVMLVGSRDERLQAIAIARQSGHRDLLPVLRRGLRDPDPGVMAAAAAAIAVVRGRSTLQPVAPLVPTVWRSRAQLEAVPVSRPRSMSRTR